VSVIAAVARVLKQWSLPLHVRWELYPVKHEAGEKAEYGGSYMEEVDWWKKERKTSLFNEAKYMVPEILLLRGLWSENRRLWRISFPFHLGLYLLIATFVLLLIGSLVMVFGGQIVPGNGWLPSLIYYLTVFFGFVSLTAGTIGVFGLLCRRLADPELKAYSTGEDYFNLSFLLLFFVVSLGAYLFSDPAFHGARAFVYGLLTLGNTPAGYPGSRSLLGSLAIFMSCLVVAYIPLTHLSHMFMKYFIYHKVRWEDTPNLKGGAMEAAILKNLGFKPTWAAPHIGADGQKTWADLAAPQPKGKK
jgi:nitrate reductase gamma subunit